MRKFTIPLAVAGLVIGSIAVTASLAAHGTAADGWQMAARYTARAAFFLFITVYLIAPLTQVFPAMNALKRERRGLGLAFAGAHYIHLAALLTFLQISGHPPSIVTVIFGGIGYVLIGAMALTSNDAAVRRLGPQNWRRLHTIGLHYTWFIFAVTYARRIAANPEMPEYVALMTLALAALALRLGTSFLKRPQTT